MMRGWKKRVARAKCQMFREAWPRIPGVECISVSRPRDDSAKPRIAGRGLTRAVSPSRPEHRTIGKRGGWMTQEVVLRLAHNSYDRFYVHRLTGSVSPIRPILSPANRTPPNEPDNQMAKQSPQMACLTWTNREAYEPRVQAQTSRPTAAPENAGKIQETYPAG